MTSAPGPVAPNILWNRNFLLWWLGSAQSALGSALAGIAMSFLVLHQTGSAGAMGINLALALFPALLSPFMGALVDRLPIRLPLVLGNLLRAALQLGVGALALRGDVPLALIYAASFLTGLVAAFYSPASMGITPRLVPPDQLERATGLMQGTQQTMQMVGLIGGGVLVSTFGKAQALLLDGLSFLVFAGLLLLVKFPARAVRQGGETFWQSFRAGLRYVRGSPLLVGLPVLALLLNASFAPIELLIPVRMEKLGVGAQGFGLFFGLVVAGMAAGSFTVAALGKRFPPALASTVGLTVMGLCMLGLAWSHTAPQMYLVGAVMGVFVAMTNFGIGVLFQKRVAPDFYGRVGSLLNMLGTAGQPLVLLALAPLADQLSSALIFGMAGGMGLLGALAWAAILRREQAASSAG